MDLKTMGEFGFLRRVRDWLGDAGSPELVEDAAALETGDGRIAVTTDALVEDVHFRFTLSSAADVGWKAVACSLSDLAALGARPRWLFVTLGAPGTTDEVVLRGLYEGIADACRAHGAIVAGGDTVRSAKLAVTIAAVGDLDGDPMRRSAARAGDILAVTGPLGRSGCGLNLLLSGDPSKGAPDDALACIAAHRRPEPRVREGLALRRAGVRCAMDLSDGLASDVHRLTDASGVGAEVDAAALPVAPEVARIGGARGWDAEAMALAGGEDYELLVALPPQDVDRVGVPLIVIGRVIGEGTWLVRDGGREPLLATGWDHFAVPELGSDA
jgi:thiamine-monophosphate kinase